MKLKYPLPAGATMLDIEGDASPVCSEIAAGNHVFLSIYANGKNETVVATACAGAKLTVQRGMDGTDTQSFPYGACVGIVRVGEGSLSEAEADGCCQCLAGISVSAVFDISRPDACSLVLSLRPTGVTAGEYCGMRVNEFGQIVEIPQNWPHSCLPIFNPCGPCDQGTDGGTGSTSAFDITYTPPIGSCVATTGSVQEALEQIDHALCTLQNLSTGVLVVSAGAGILVGGTAANPVVALKPTGISVGTYDGFDINEFGQVVGYAAPTPPPDVVVAGSAPISVAFNVPSKTYTVSVAAATTAAPGVVQLAGLAEAQAWTPTSTNGIGGRAVTLEVVYQMIQQSVVAPTAFSIGALPVAGSIAPGDFLAIFDGADRRIARDDTILSLAGAWARGRWLSGTGLASQRNIASVVQINPTQFRVTLSAALVSDYIPQVTPFGSVPVSWSVQKSSGSIFDIFFSAAPAEFGVLVFGGPG